MSKLLSGHETLPLIPHTPRSGEKLRVLLELPLMRVRSAQNSARPWRSNIVKQFNGLIQLYAFRFTLAQLVS